MPELERLQHVNDQLKREAGIQRTKVSVTANELKDYTLNEPDPLIEGIPKRDNPFVKKSSCTIL